MRYLNYIIKIIVLLLGFTSNAQVLFHETFDTYPVGPITTDDKNLTPGYGGWVVYSYADRNKNNTYDVTPEVGRGNVFVTGSLNKYPGQGSGVKLMRFDILDIWQKRTAGNNIFLFEYDAWLAPNIAIEGFNNGFALESKNLSTKYLFEMSSYGIPFKSDRTETNNGLMFTYYKLGSPKVVTVPLGVNNTRMYENFPYGRWFTVKLYIEYFYEMGVKTGAKVHLFVPDLYILKSATLEVFEDVEILNLESGSAEEYHTIAKYDNIKITALKQMPDLKASVNELISQKFTIYPNPASNLVTITNNDNLSVQQITIYDMAGKQISTHTFNTEANVQLNVEN